jgi:hypothetical protein
LAPERIEHETMILDAIFNPFSKNIFEKVGDKRNAKFWLEECAVCERSNKLFSLMRDKEIFQ